jgi:YHS domain-containing protein
MTTATDPVCGMTVDVQNAIQSTYLGESYYFCSEDCKTEWDASPQEFLSHEEDVHGRQEVQKPRFHENEEQAEG